MKIVHATTAAEFDAALDTADQVIVEGDEGLLTYAIERAASDPQNRIAPQTEGADPSPVFRAWVEDVKRRSLPPPQPPRRRWPLREIIFTVAAILIGALWAGIPFTSLSPIPTSQFWLSAPPLPPPQGIATDLSWLAWPVVTVVAIVALAVIAWRAISAGSNVEVSWRVTEKISGRLVITKVRAPARRSQKAV